MKKLDLHDTIVACATPPGYGGVGIIRVSGKSAQAISKKILKKELKVKEATYLPFYDDKGQVIDRGIAIFFKGPNSFTGEDVLELQGHGGPIILDCLLKELLKIEGVRVSRPGEFSQRAFLNDKIDLVQAESINSLIHASNEASARAAVRSLEGDFSGEIRDITNAIINIRMFIESALDFAEEEIDFLGLEQVFEKLKSLIHKLKIIIENASQGELLSCGLKTVIIGKPNAGKSSLLNALARKNVSIVTEIPGTTRDIIKSNIQLGQLTLELIDTAGIRESSDIIEQEGIKRAHQEIKSADVLIIVSDIEDKSFDTFLKGFNHEVPVFILKNKIDKKNIEPKVAYNKYTEIYISAKEKKGLDLIEKELIKKLNLNVENNFFARKRHVDSLKKALLELELGEKNFEENKALELLAYHLKIAQDNLSEILGEFTNDDLLGKIFSEFCIGK